MTTIKTVPLSTLKKGESCKIDSFQDDDLSLKLMEMGCLPGTPITVSNIAPLGDPIAITVREYQLALRKKRSSIDNSY